MIDASDFDDPDTVTLIEAEELTSEEYAAISEAAAEAAEASANGTDDGEDAAAEAAADTGDSTEDPAGAADTADAADEAAAASSDDDSLPTSADGTEIGSIKVAWITGDDAEDGDDSRLTLVKSTNDSFSVKMRITFELSGDDDYDIGTISITIPRNIFENRDGSEAGTVVLSVPEAPDSTATFAYTETEDYYILTNTKKLSSATSVMIEVAVDSLVPSKLVGNGELEDGATSNSGVEKYITDAFWASIEVITSSGTTIGMTSNEIDASIDTSETIGRATGKYTTFDTSWPSGWDESLKSLLVDEDGNDISDEYIYVVYYTWVSVSGSQYYSMSVTSSVSLDTNVEDAEGCVILGMSSSYTGLVVNSSGSEDLSTMTLSLTDSDYLNSGNSGYYVYTYVAVPKSSVPDVDASEEINEAVYTITDKTTYTLTSLDDGNVTTAEVEVDVEYNPISYTSYDGYYTVDVYGGQAHIGYSDGISGYNYPYALNLLQNGEDVDAKFKVVSTIFTGISNVKTDGTTAAFTFDTEHYAWKFNNNTDEEDADDVAFSSITIVKPSVYEYVQVTSLQSGYYYNGTGWDYGTITAGSWGYVLNTDPDDGDVPDVTVYISTDGGETYTLYAAVSWQTGSAVVTYAEEAKGISSGNTVTFPDGVTDVITSITVDGGYYSSSDDTYYMGNGYIYSAIPTFTIHPTEDISAQVEELFANSATPSTILRDFAWGYLYVNYIDTDDAGGADESGETEDSGNMDDTGDTGGSGDTGDTDDADDADDSASAGTVTYDPDTRGTVIEEEFYTFGSADDQLSGVSIAATIMKSASYTNDTSSGAVTISYTTKVYEVSNLTSSDDYAEALSLGAFEEETGGTFYDLLPEGAVLDESSVQMTSTGDYVLEVEQYEDYQGSGRTLVVITVYLTPTISNLNKSDTGAPYTGYGDSFTLAYDVVYSWESLEDYGANPVNVVAFESDNESLGTLEGFAGEPDNPTYGNQTAASAAVSGVEDVMTNLDAARDDPSFIYASVTTDLSSVTVSSTLGLSKSVTNGDGTYSDGRTESSPVNVYGNGFYTYRLGVTNSDSVSRRGIVIYDALEGYTPTSNNDDYQDTTWKGTLVSVNTTVLEKAGVNAVVYYSTKTDIDLTDTEDTSDCDLTDTSVWSTQAPDDLSTVTAIAVDCSETSDGTDFVLEPGESISVSIKMQAPALEEDDWADTVLEEDESEAGNTGGAHAYNISSVLSSTYSSGEWSDPQYVFCNYTKVGLKPFTVSVEKSFDDADDQDGLREESVTVSLLADGVSVASGKLSDENDWSYDFGTQDYLNEDGEKIVYTIAESMEGYTVSQIRSYDDDGGLVISVTNIHVPETIDISGEKVWDDDDNAYGARPESVTVALYADGKKVETKTITEEDDWSYLFTDLDKYRDQGTKIVYTVQETAYYEGYITKVDGYDVTNTYYPYGDLVISKSAVDTTSAENEDAFTFELLVYDADNDLVTDTFAYTIYDNDNTKAGSGTITSGGRVSITASQTVKIFDIPSECTYTVEEISIPDGFTLTASKGTADTIQAGCTYTASFTNTYSATGKVYLSARKTLSDRTLVSGQFTFTVTDEDGDVVRSAYNASDGTVSFSAISYTEADVGEHTYYISETDAGRDGYTYDDTVYIAVVTVTDNGDGTLSVSVIYKDSSGNALTSGTTPTFSNTYTASGSLVLTAFKEMENGADIADYAGAFSFELVDAQGNTLSTVTNDADGVVTFKALSYTQADIGKTYTYKAMEVVPEEDDENYDEDVVYDSKTTITYTVTVADNGDGTLSFTVTTSTTSGTDSDEETGTDPVFTNGLADGELTIAKTISDGSTDDEEDTEFTFHIVFTGEDLEDQTYTYTYSLASDVTGSSGEEAAQEAGETEGTEEAMETQESEEDAEDTPSVSSLTIEPDDGDEPGASEELDNEDTSGDTVLLTTSSLVSRTASLTNMVLTSDTDYEVAAAATKTYSGTTGTCNWSLNTSTGVLSFKPTSGDSGTLGVYTSYSDVPWYKYYSYIKSVKSEGDISAGTSLAYYFYYCKNLTDISGLSDWDVSNVTSLVGTFYYCSSLTSLDLSGWDVSNVTSLVNTFAYCKKLTSLDLSGWDVSNVTSLSGTFFYCSKLTSLDLSGWDVSNVTSLGNTFAYCSSLTSLNLSGWDVSNVTSLSGTFFYCSKLTSLDLSGWDTSSVTTLCNMFYYCSKLTSLDLSGWDISSVTTLYMTFYSCGKLTGLDLSGWDTSSVTTLEGTFWYCSGLTSLDLSGWDTSNVTTLYMTFRGCSSLTSLNLSGWDTSSVTTLYETFYNCKSLTSLNLSGWDTSSVTKLHYAFYSCSKLTSLDLSGWDISNVTSIRYMFYNCVVLTTIYASDLWGTEKASNSQDNTFTNCWGLVGGNGTTYNSSRVTGTYARIDKDGQVGYFTYKAYDSYKIYYKANAKLSEISGSMDYGTMSTADGASYTIAENKYTYGTHDFVSWNTAADGTGTSYAANQLITSAINDTTAGHTTYLYAQWTTGVSYDANTDGGVYSGSAASEEVKDLTIYTVSESVYYRPGYTFTGWNTAADGTGTAVTAGSTGTLARVSADTAGNITLYAQWTEKDTSATVTDNTLTITLNGGEAATISGLPAGVGYLVYEETEAGWVLVESSGTSGEIEPNETAVAVFENTYNPEATTVTLQATKTLDGDPADADTFSFTLTATGGTGADGNAIEASDVPMPASTDTDDTDTDDTDSADESDTDETTSDTDEDADANTDSKGTSNADADSTNADSTSVTVKNTAGGGVSFGTITYTKAGTYYYTISEVTGTDSTISYDSTTYKVTVVVEEKTAEDETTDDEDEDADGDADEDADESEDDAESESSSTVYLAATVTYTRISSTDDAAGDDTKDSETDTEDTESGSEDSGTDTNNTGSGTDTNTETGEDADGTETDSGEEEAVSSLSFENTTNPGYLTISKTLDSLTTSRTLSDQTFTVVISYDGGRTTETVTLDSSNNWTWTSEALEAGTTYTVTETDLPDGYSLVSIEEDDTDSEDDGEKGDGDSTSDNSDETDDADDTDGDTGGHDSTQDDTGTTDDTDSGATDTNSDSTDGDTDSSSVSGTITSDTTNEVTVTNSYYATGSFNASASKTLTGRTLTAGEFEFELVRKAADTDSTEGGTDSSDEDTDSSDGDANGTDEDSDNTTSTNDENDTSDADDADEDEVLSTAVNAADGSITFDAVTVDTTDYDSCEKQSDGTIKYTYTYVIREVEGDDTTVDYDSQEITVTVTATDSGTGSLSIGPITYSDADGNALEEASFTNALKTGSLAITKDVDVASAANADQEFTFTISLTDTDGNAITGTYETETTSASSADKGTDKADESTDTSSTDGTNTNSETDETNTTDGANETETADEAADSAEEATTDSTTDADSETTGDGTANASSDDVTEDGSSENDDDSTTVTFTDGTATVTLTAGQTITISGLPMDASYTVTETALDGYTTSVTDTDDSTSSSHEASGTIEADVTDTVSYTNTYAAETTWTPEATKILTGGVDLEDGEFRFELWDEDETTLLSVGYNDSASYDADTGQASAAVTFTTSIGYDVDDIDSTLGYSKFTYLLKEVKGTGSSSDYTYDETVYTVVVKVTDNGDGTLSVSAVYTAVSDNSETETGDTEESAEASETANTTETTETTDATNTADTTGTTDTANTAETTETTETADTTDTADETNGSSDTDADDTTSSDAATFTNAALPGSLSITKTVIGPTDAAAENTTHTISVKLTDASGSALTETYSYTIYDADDAETAASTGMASPNSEGVYTFGLKASQTVVIEGLPIGANYTIYEGTVSEGYEQQSILTSDGETVTAAEGAVSAKATGTIALNTQDTVTVTNVYSAYGTYTPTVSKTMRGASLEAGAYSFTLTRTDEDGNALTGDEAYSNTATNPAAADGETGLVTFEELTFETEGTYYYTVQEVIPDGAVYNASADTWTYDDVVYDDAQIFLTVTATDVDGDGTLTINVSYTGSSGEAESGSYTQTSGEETDAEDLPALVNRVAPDAAEDVLTAQKVVEGGYTLSAGDFAFVLTDAQTGEAVDTAKCASDGTVTFDALTFDAAGTYVYTVTEKNTGASGISYDGTVYTVTYTVTDDGGDTLILDKEITSTASSGTEEEITFTNTYDPERITVSVSGIKQIDNTAAGTSRVPQDGEFTFLLEEVDENGNAVDGGVSMTTTNVGSGFTFTDVASFTEPGVHYYKITESAGSDTSITYSTQSYIVTVTVTGDQVLTGEEDEETETSDTADSEGTDPADSTGGSDSTDSGTGDSDETDTAGSTDEDETDSGAGADDADAAGSTGGDGADATDSTDTADSTDGAGVTDDSGSTDDSDGTDSTDSTDDSDGTDSTDSTDETDETSGSGAAEDADASDAAAGAAVYAASVSRPRSVISSLANVLGILFGSETVSAAAVSTSQDVTQTDSAASSAADAAADTDASDESSGTVLYENLTAAIDMDSADLIFTNVYTPAEAAVTLSARKTLSGAQLEDGQFRFVLTDVDGTQIETVTNDADGAVTFSELTFDEVGTYIYALKEVLDDQENITYDEAVHTAVIIVTDDGEGALTASVIWDGDRNASEPAFANTYNPSGDEDDGDDGNDGDDDDDDDSGDGDDGNGDGDGSDDGDTNDDGSTDDGNDSGDGDDGDDEGDGDDGNDDDGSDDGGTPDDEDEDGGDDGDDGDDDGTSGSGGGSGSPGTGDADIRVWILLLCAALSLAAYLKRRMDRTDRTGTDG